jgi:hypothetical protein
VGIFSIDVSNVLNEEKRQQVIALGRLGWPLRRIQEETGIRRETAATYLKAAGIAVRPPRGWGRRPPALTTDETSADSSPVSKPANEVSPNSGAGMGSAPAPATEPKPANESRQVSPDSAPVCVPGRSPTASACEPYFDFIDLSLSKGRNAKAIYQDLVDDHGFTGRYQSVKRFVRQLRGRPGTLACGIIITAPGEDYGESGVMVRAASPVACAHCRVVYCVAPSFP